MENTKVNNVQEAFLPKNAVISIIAEALGRIYRTPAEVWTDAAEAWLEKVPSVMPQEGSDGKQPMGNMLWDILKKHAGHRVEIAAYGDPEDPVDICLEDIDTNEVVLDAELYTIAPRGGI